MTRWLSRPGTLSTDASLAHCPRDRRCTRAASGALLDPDPETLDLDDAVRRETPGNSSPHRRLHALRDRRTGGRPPRRPRRRVQRALLHLGSDFEALTEAGFRVLRYDYYGRGFSDRPDVPYTQAFYVRQLDRTARLAADHRADRSRRAVPRRRYRHELSRTRFLIACGRLIYVDPSFRSPGPPPTSAPAVCGTSSPRSSRRRDGRTNNPAISCIRSAFPTGPTATGSRCGIAASDGRGCRN